MRFNLHAYMERESERENFFVFPCLPGTTPDFAGYPGNFTLLPATGVIPPRDLQMARVDGDEIEWRA